jgi:hypothetical protein
MQRPISRHNLLESVTTPNWRRKKFENNAELQDPRKRKSEK